MDWTLIVMIAQTIIYALTVIVLISQRRAQVLTIRASRYEKCESDYSSLLRMFVEQQHLQVVYDELANRWNWNWPKYEPKEKILYNYIELNYELFERVFYLWKKGWIDKETWLCWEVWIVDLLAALYDHPIFLDVIKDNKGMFGADFEEYVTNKVAERQIKASVSAL